MFQYISRYSRSLSPSVHWHFEGIYVGESVDVWVSVSNVLFIQQRNNTVNDELWQTDKQNVCIIFPSLARSHSRYTHTRFCSLLSLGTYISSTSPITTHDDFVVIFFTRVSAFFHLLSFFILPVFRWEWVHFFIIAENLMHYSKWNGM